MGTHRALRVTFKASCGEGLRELFSVVFFSWCILFGDFSGCATIYVVNQQAEDVALTLSQPIILTVCPAIGLCM